MMFGRPITLFKLFGFEVRLDVSWVFFAFLIVWSLAVAFFPARYPDLLPQSYWLMGGLGAAGLFLSVILHELSHSLVARYFGLPIKGITLFIFGGVAEMDDEPSSPGAEFFISAVGPASSLFLAAGLYGMHTLGSRSGWLPPLLGVIQYLAAMNIILAAFNLVPAFPLDGGRILRSILWKIRNDHEWATVICGRIGSGFGVFMMVVGIATAFSGRFMSGIWWFLIGIFIKGAADRSNQQMLVQRALEGETVRNFMAADPVTVPSSITLAEFVKDYVYRYRIKTFPVVEGERTIGGIGVSKIKSVPRAEWERRTVGELAEKSTSENSINAGKDVITALKLLEKTSSGWLFVTDDGHVIGILSIQEILRYLSIRNDIGK